MFATLAKFGDLLTTTRISARSCAVALVCERRNHLQQDDLASLLPRPKCQHAAPASARGAAYLRSPVFGASEFQHRGNRRIGMDPRVMAVMDATIDVIVVR